MTSQPQDPWHHDEAQASDFVALDAQQAQAWRARHPVVSPWWVIGAQVVLGGLVALVAWGWSGRAAVAWSAAYGALAVVLPAAVFARGLTSRLSSVHPGAAALGFFVWEAVKIALTIAMLFAAPRLVTALSWPAMLAGLVLTMKVYWLALAFRRKAAPDAKKSNG